MCLSFKINKLLNQPFFIGLKTYKERAKLLILFSCSNSALREVINSICDQEIGENFQIRTVQSNDPVNKKPFFVQAKQDIESS